ncbi:MAG: hypothetical protein OQJ97_06410 [Rhodospirillales bacterium]|nr:hypothetical protein [Rhodospirillales bacterium]
MKNQGLNMRSNGEILTKLYRSVLLTFFLVTTYSTPSIGQDNNDCPKSIAVVSKNTLTAAAADILRQTYAELGCSITLSKSPGRRGIQQFNHKLVDGEVFRIKKAETLYEREFIRSEAPLFSVSNSLWAHPFPDIIRGTNTGYTLGIIWQEQYHISSIKKAYHNTKKLFQAYDEDLLKDFLATDYNVKTKINSGFFRTPPYIKKNISTVPVFHYLGKEFAPFMKRFSAYLKTKKPFAIIDLNPK